MLKFGEGRVSVSGSVQFGHPRENRAVWATWEARCEGKWVSGPGDLLGPEGTAVPSTTIRCFRWEGLALCRSPPRGWTPEAFWA